MGSSPSPHPGESHHIKKGAWTKDEDRRLVTYIQCHGIGCWPSVPKAAGLLRSGKSCRLRWVNYLSPSIKRGNFTDEEEDVIINLYSVLGSRWSIIARHLPGRTDNDVRNYWNSYIRKKLLKRGTDPLFSFPSESIAEKEEKLKSPAGSTSNDEDSDGSDQVFSYRDFSKKPALDIDPYHQNFPADDGLWLFPIKEHMLGYTRATDATTGCPLSPTYAPIPEDLQNGDKVVLQLDSDNDATQNERNVAAVEQSNTNDAGFEQSNTTTSVACLDKTCITKTPQTDYITTKICISREVLKQHFGMNLEDASKSLGISRSSLKRMCRENGIERWPSRKRKKINQHPSNHVKVNNKLVGVSEKQNKESNMRDCFDSPPKQAATVADTVPHATPLRDASSVTIKATYGDDIIKFQLPFSSGMDDLREKVAKRLNLEVGTFKLKHKDDAGDLVLITCDEDLQDCMCRCRSLDKATIDMLVLLISYQSK